MSDVLLGADLGTSGLKLVAVGEDGATVAEAECGYAIVSPRRGWAEIDVGTWTAALEGTLEYLAPALAGCRVRALGFAGQMHGAVLLDATGAPLRPALLWPDARASGELDRWRALPEDERAVLANPLAPGMTGPLVAWVSRNESHVLARAAAVVLPKDALRAALVPGSPAVTDRSDASATLLWDVPGDRWSAAAVAAAGVEPTLLPEVRPAAEVVGTAGTPVGGMPVVVGGADTPLALLAAGTSRGVQVNLGTGAQVVRPGAAPRPAVDPPVHCYADVADGWYAMAALQNGGAAWSWACRVLGLTWAELFGAAAATPAGAGGAVFRPFLTGERGAVAAPGERGSWTGLHPGTTRADLARAAVEGVVFAVQAAVGLVDDGGPVVLTGGGARPPVVRQLLADALGRPVAYLPSRSASATGAAVLAGRGVGIEVPPPRTAETPVDPRPSPDLTAAVERWRR